MVGLMSLIALYELWVCLPWLPWRVLYEQFDFCSNYSNFIGLVVVNFLLLKFKQDVLLLARLLALI